MELENSLREAKASYNNMLDLYYQCSSKYAQVSKKEIFPQDQSMLETYKEKFEQAFENCCQISGRVDRVLSDLKGGSHKLVDNNSFSSIITDFNNYLSNLTLTEICLVINITSAMFILSCLVTIILAFYGNFIINKFSLEKKYPKLAKLINARHTLQHSYVVFNTSIIVVTLIGMIIINFICLTN
uniref:Uncharacterized protein n=1 Tax=Beauveria lii TaxID=1290591 RepID=A0A7S6PW13_9HYPO|nr:hypothetical protein J2C28_mgp18 [Beauveria lii]QOU11079.1 hypothetical protein [Beauveria lii]